MLGAIAHADVTFTFDSDLEGWEQQANATNVAWSSVNGGSMAITANGGWAGQATQLSLGPGTPVWDELVSAAANGGSISYDVIIQDGDQTYTMNPTWFETVAIMNSAGGWDQDVIAHGLADTDWPLTSTFTTTATLPIDAAAGAADDGNKFYDLSGNWGQLTLGLNNDGAAVQSATVYIDNVTITAVPEPALNASILLGLVALARRRRR